LVFQNFVCALARKDHPLVVFLDDLQWADSATLSLLTALLTSQNLQNLFLIGAYRDNEVDAAHPLMRTFGELESAGVGSHRVTLGPLRLPDLMRFLHDTLRGEITEVAPLANLVREKTRGNPFFVIQFLKTLKQEGFLEFDYAEGRWTYRVEDIAGAGVTDNVIDLMTRNIQRLSSRTQRILTLASCVGNPFDHQTLAIVPEPRATEQKRRRKGAGLNQKKALMKVLSWVGDGGWGMGPGGRKKGAVARNPQSAVRNPQSYSFLHDRVQQAAYALIPPERKQIVHLTVGRLLRERADLEHAEELFDVVNHLNLGGGLISEETERLALARLNLNAGRKAESSTAFEAALNYFKAGAGLLTEEHWESDYDLTFALHLDAAECQYLCGDFDEVERQIDALLERARTNLDKAAVYKLRSVQYE